MSSKFINLFGNRGTEFHVSNAPATFAFAIHNAFFPKGAMLFLLKNNGDNEVLVHQEVYLKLLKLRLMEGRSS